MTLEQWEVFYRSGALATGPAGPDGLYDQELASAWQEYFEGLPAAARLLDIGTGNGVLPLMALAAARVRSANWEIDATDLARIDPRHHVADGERRFAGVRFHAGVANERLPFEEAQFDGVSGHYALEYGDTGLTLREVFRVLKPGGHAQFILHHDQSVLLSSARRSMAECDLVFKQTRIYRKLHRLVSFDGAPGTSLQRAQDELSQAIRDLREALRAAQARARGEGRILSVALDATRSLLAARRQGRPSAVALEVDRAEQDLRSAWRRLNDLVAHAIDDEGIQRIRQQALDLGFGVAGHGPLHHARENLVGWRLRLVKDSPGT